jgi:type IV pilus assembly protein PilA
MSIAITNSSSAGFTLIELMIVVGIIGILAAIAIPAYQDYTIRGQVSEGLTLVAEAKYSVSEFRSTTGTLPTSNASSGMPLAGAIVGNYVTSIDVAGGTIAITFGNKANSAIVGTTLTLNPATVGGTATSTSPLAWVCGYSATPTGTALIAYEASTINERYLPSSCRN